MVKYDMRKCTTCKRTKALTEFYAAKYGKNGLKAACKKCYNAANSTWQQENREAANGYAKKYRERNKEAVRLARKRSMVRKLYGLTLEEYEKKVKDAKCAICKKKIKLNRHCMDHDHATGKVREVLCNPCNTGIGCFRDSPELLKAAIAYLRKHSDS